MKARCTNPNASEYAAYGGRGIVVCEEWAKSFESFMEWSMNNGYSEELTIDRIDPDGNYEPSNCRWIDLKAQENNRTNNRLITFNGETKTLMQWAETLGVYSGTLFYRLKAGWTVERALTTPVRNHKTYEWEK